MSSHAIARTNTQTLIIYSVQGVCIESVNKDKQCSYTFNDTNVCYPTTQCYNEAMCLDNGSCAVSLPKCRDPPVLNKADTRDGQDLELCNPGPSESECVAQA